MILAADDCINIWIRVKSAHLASEAAAAIFYEVINQKFLPLVSKTCPVFS